MTVEPSAFPLTCDASGAPRPRGLYASAWEHDSCGVGFVARLDGVARHSVVEDAVRILINLEHRGALGGDTCTGDGAGVLMQIPDGFLRAECQAASSRTPEGGKLRRRHGFPAVGCRRCASAACRRSSASPRRKGAAWSAGARVAVNAGPLGELAQTTQPEVRQILLSRGANPAGGVRAQALRHPPARREGSRRVRAKTPAGSTSPASPAGRSSTRAC